MNAVQQVILPAYPMISFPSKHIRSFTGGVMNLAEDYNDDMAYLIRQGQKEVIEEDGGGGKRIILVAILYSQPQKR